MCEANVNSEVENELVDTLAIAIIKSLTTAAFDGIVTNKREGTAYSVGFLAAIAVFIDTATSMEVLKKMSGRE